MNPCYHKNNITLYCGDLLNVLPTLPEASVDFVVTDPPYGLSFMGKGWDHGVPGVPYWQTIMRVCKPVRCCWPSAARGPTTGSAQRLKTPAGRFGIASCGSTVRVFQRRPMSE